MESLGEHFPHPGCPGLVLAQKQSWGKLFGAALDTLVHTFKGEGTCFRPLVRSWTWPCFLPGTKVV